MFEAHNNLKLLGLRMDGAMGDLRIANRQLAHLKAENAVSLGMLAGVGSGLGRFDWRVLAGG